MKRKYGKFRIYRASLEQETAALFEVMSKVIVVKAEYALAIDAIDYTAYSEEFDEVELGIEVPEYLPIIYTRYGEDGEVIGYSVKFEKVLE